MNAHLPGRGLTAAAVTATVALALAACSSPHSHHSHDPATSVPASAPATKAAASTHQAAGMLTGTWTGKYSGSYHGTFTVRWRQSGSRLHGTIHISNPPGTLPINGKVNGSAIRFGTVGSTSITYSGTVSGNSMSGTYRVAAGNGSGGPWSASKS